MAGPGKRYMVGSGTHGLNPRLANVDQSLYLYMYICIDVIATIYPPAPVGATRLQLSSASHKSLSKSTVTGHQSSVGIRVPVPVIWHLPDS